MHIPSVASALPPHYYDQETLISALRAQWATRHHNLARIESLHRNVQVGGRYLALPLERYADLKSFGEANDAWIAAALDLGEETVRKAVESAGVSPNEVGAFFSTTVTGVAVPSIEARLLNRLPLHPHVKRIPLFGLGCVAGAAGISRASDYVRAYPGQAALLLSVELCSLTFQRGDLSVPNLISSGLFGDGAATAVVVGEDLGARLADPGPRVVDHRSVFYPETEHLMGWHVSEDGMRIILSADVPNVARERMPADVDAFLASHRLSRKDIASWICHPGGPRVLEALEEGMDLHRDELAVTWQTLREVGNLSSTSILRVFEVTRRDHRPPEGSYGLMLAMGPGFCSEMVLLKW